MALLLNKSFNLQHISNDIFILHYLYCCSPSANFPTTSPTHYFMSRNEVQREERKMGPRGPGVGPEGVWRPESDEVSQGRREGVCRSSLSGLRLISNPLHRLQGFQMRVYWLLLWDPVLLSFLPRCDPVWWNHPPWDLPGIWQRQWGACRTLTRTHFPEGPPKPP